MVVAPGWSGDTAHCAGVRSAVGAHGWNINESDFFWHGLVVVSCGEYGACFLFWGVGGLESVRGVMCPWLCLAHCWVLRQQDLQRNVAGLSGGSPLCGGCSGVSGFPVLAGRMVVSLRGGAVWGVGVGVVV